MPATDPRPPLRVASPPSAPLLLFDGDCGFCRYWIARWRIATAGGVDYAPYQEAGGRFPEIPTEALRRAVHLIEPDGAVTTAAEAVFRALANAPGRGAPLWVYRHVPLARPISEGFYGLVASHRVAFSKLTLWLWGRHKGPSTYDVSRRIFLALLALIYAIAFASLGVQIAGLAGSDGILPAQQTLDAIRTQFGSERYHLYPTLFYFTGAGDGILKAACWGGVAVSALLLAGVAPPLCLFVLWALYLSLCTAVRVFLNYQWDILLLEAGFLAIFLAPRQWFFRPSRARPPSAVALFLARWLVFRLMFGSGIVKLASGDPTWWSLTALQYHYETQPLATWTAWYAHLMPAWAQKGSVAAMFAIELLAPWFALLGPRRLRIAAALLFTALMIAIGATGNYCFFNILSVALALLFVDDHFWPERVRRLAGRGDAAAETGFSGPSVPPRRRLVPLWVSLPVAAAVVLLSGTGQLARARLVEREPGILETAHEWIAPFRSLNPYGLFAVMTTSRPEIVVEGSDDGATWKAYEFKWKPGDLSRAPAFVQPHQPRLDWQMWFAALGSYQRTPWFNAFLRRLLEGSPAVLGLMGRNPFPDHPPRYVRALLYDYHFTTWAERRATGDWWKREERGLYAPPLALGR